MPCDIARCGAVEARVIRDLDLPPARLKTRALIETERGRMIERTGVKPDAADRLRPCARECAIHQKARGAAADQVCRDAEEDNLALTALPEIKLEQPFVAAIMHQRMDFDAGRLK
jgi:hypothetical protein